MPEKTALVLSAGGIFGAYQVGAWKELATCFRPDLVVGTSAGALNGWAIAGACPPEELIRYWMSDSAATFLTLRLPLRPWRRLFDPAVFSSRVQAFFSAFRPQIPFGAVLTDLLRLRPRLVQSPDVTWEHLAAACSIPVALPAVRIDGRLYVDGGLLSVLPLWAAAEMGASRAIAVNTLPELPSRILRAGVRAIRWISPKAPAPGALQVISIAPAGPLGTLSESVRWERRAIERWIAQGAEDARRVIASGLTGRDFPQRVLQ